MGKNPDKKPRTTLGYELREAKNKVRALTDQLEVLRYHLKNKNKLKPFLKGSYEYPYVNVVQLYKGIKIIARIKFISEKKKERKSFEDWIKNCSQEDHDNLKQVWIKILY